MLRAAHDALAGALLVAAAACTRRDPPAPDASPSVALPEVAPTPPGSPSPELAPTVASASPSRSLSPSLSPSPSPSPSLSPGASADAVPPPAADLPQTHDRPEASGAAFDARVAALWAGIVADDPARAMPFFFPLGAYRQVKDVADPEADWKHRLVAAYAHDVHALHARLGDNAGGATLLGIDVPEAHARWVEPGEEYNKLGYYRVFGSRLRYTAGDQTRSVEVKSLISWRGEWYVVHLSAIQ
jgi:hypothetical protein